MKRLIIVACLALSACVSVPVDRTFPAVPDELLKPAPDLQALDTPNPQLSDLINNANDNYAQYYKLQDKYNGWIEWYNTQKKIFETVK